MLPILLTAKNVKKCLFDQKMPKKVLAQSGGVGGGGQIDTPSIFLALNFCSFTKAWDNCFLFVNTSFDTS